MRIVFLLQTYHKNSLSEKGEMPYLLNQIKTMKQFIVILISMMILSSCSSNITPVEDPDAKTTVQLQQMEGDTVILKMIKDDNIHLMSLDNKVKYEIIASSDVTEMVLIPFDFILFVVVIYIFGFVGLIVLVNN